MDVPSFDTFILVTIILSWQRESDAVYALYDGGKAVLTTGSSYLTFVLDKTADVVWDRQLCKYLSIKGIAYEIL